MKNYQAELIRAGMKSMLRCFQFLIIMVLALPVNSGSVLPGENDLASCMEFLGSPDLYDSCVEKLKSPEIEPDSGVSNDETDEATCYCDIRKQKQVEFRLKRQAEQDQEQSSTDSRDSLATD